MNREISNQIRLLYSYHFSLSIARKYNYKFNMKCYILYTIMKLKSSLLILIFVCGAILVIYVVFIVEFEWRMTLHRLNYTVEPHHNEVLGTKKITLLYQVSHYIRVKKQRNIKSWDQQNYLVVRGFCYIRPLYNEVPLYYVSQGIWIQGNSV